jgi:serine/threonine-protein kinase
VYDAGVDYRLWYWVTPHVPGGTVTDLLARSPTPLPVRTAAGIVRQAARGVAAAHAAGTTHGCLTPGTLLWDEAARRVLVTGFELAWYAGACDPDRAGAVLGLPVYPPPEALRVAAPVDGRLADVYALGVLLYRLLAGQPPYTGTVYEVMIRAVEGRPQPPSAVRPGLDPALDAVCLMAMAADPADRYPSAKALAAALRPFARGG